MSGGYRRIVIAAVGWLALCGAQPPAKQADSNKGAQKAAPTAQATARPAPATPTSPPGKFAAYPDYNAEACYKANDKDAADLCAQWRAAVATEKTVKEARRATNWSIAATFLSLVTVVALIITIWQTNGALREARRGNRLNLLFERRARREARKNDADQAQALTIAERNANAAERAVQQAQDATALASRAYVGSNGGRVNWDIGGTFGGVTGNWAIIQCRIENVGKTPALKCGVWADLVFVPTEQTLADFKAPTRGEGDYQHLLPGHGAWSGPICTLAESIDRCVRGEQAAYLFCHVEYNDVFSQTTRHSHYCFKIMVNGSSSEIIANPESNLIDFASHTDFNWAD